MYSDKILKENNTTMKKKRIESSRILSLELQE